MGLNTMIKILIAYAALSATFSLGFVAGTWWVARARHERASLKMEMIKRNDDTPEANLATSGVFYCLGQRI